MAAEATEGGIEGLSARMQRHPRDLLRHFSGTSCLDEAQKGAGGGSAEIELSLGLSLGGCFGVEPGERRLVRSSSIADLSMFPEEHELAAAVLPIARTCSLPVDTEEEHRKRKELQSLKRLEAKRKRSEKRRSRSGARDPKEENLDEDTKASGFPGFPTASLIGGTANGVAPPELPVWSMAAGRAAARPVDAPRCFGPVSQGSVGSQGSSSSSVSDFESRMLQGFDISGLSSSTEVKSPSIVASPHDRINQKPMTTNPATTERKPIKPSGGGDDFSKKKVEVANGTMEMERSMMEEMPCVSTIGDGPNGRRVEGFLYKYKKGEEVRIVCVCHGSFLTPAEFVRHAGGGDVAHPLRHIVVNPSPPAFL